VVEAELGGGRRVSVESRSNGRGLFLFFLDKSLRAT
jgi:hypothetical protein